MDNHLHAQSIQEVSMPRRQFYRTILQVTVLTEQPYQPQSLATVAEDIDTGDAPGKWALISQAPFTPQDAARELEQQGSDSEFFGLSPTGWDLANLCEGPATCAHCGHPIDPACAGHAAFCNTPVHDECLHDHVTECVSCQEQENAWDREHGRLPTWAACSECGGTVCRKHSPDAACGRVVHGHCRQSHASKCRECQSILVTAPPPSTWVEILV
jgi:hypothetical protein